MSDEEFISAFEACTLQNEDFHHADHVRMAFLYLCRFPVLEALRGFSEGLQRFARAHGKPGLYHETITWAFVFLIRERLVQHAQRTGTEPTWNEFAASNSDLLTWKSNILNDYYLDETLASDLARSTFILPNRTARRCTPGNLNLAEKAPAPQRHD
jgi:hypothetical protein